MTPRENTLTEDIVDLLDKTDAQSREECERLRHIQKREERSWDSLLQWPTPEMAKGNE